MKSRDSELSPTEDPCANIFTCYFPSVLQFGGIRMTHGVENFVSDGFNCGGPHA